MSIKEKLYRGGIWRETLYNWNAQKREKVDGMKMQKGQERRGTEE